MKTIQMSGHLPEEHAQYADTNEETRARNIDDQTPFSEPALNKSDEQKLKVLIVDDSTEVRNRLKEMFKENESIQLVGESEDAEQALTALRRLVPDVVILDIHMPLGGGRRVLRDIRKMNSGSIVIIFTAFPYPQYRSAYLSDGADYFFDKTKDTQELTDVLAALARGHLLGDNREDQDETGNQKP